MFRALNLNVLSCSRSPLLTNEPVIPILSGSVPIALWNSVPFNKKVLGHVGVFVLRFIARVEDPIIANDVPLIVFILEIVDY